MGLVLAFQTAPRAASRPAPKRPEPARSADIVFFTGVRYERHGRPEPSARATSAQSADQSQPVS